MVDNVDLVGTYRETVIVLPLRLIENSFVFQTLSSFCIDRICQNFSDLRLELKTGKIYFYQYFKLHHFN